MSDEDRQPKAKGRRAKRGRPRKGETPDVPYAELDRVLVHGEVAERDGKSETVYPSYRTLAARYGVSASLIGQYSKAHRCMARRAEAKARVAARVDQNLVDDRAGAEARSREDTIRVIDRYLEAFEKALLEGTVRMDNPGDFDRLVRLKEFLLGGADSRQEIHGALTLEAIQARHKAMLEVEAGGDATRGEVPAHPPAGGRGDNVRTLAT